MGLMNPVQFDKYEPMNMFEKGAKNLFEQASKKGSAATVAWRAIQTSLGEDKMAPMAARGGVAYKSDAEKRGPEASTNPIPTPDTPPPDSE